MKFTLKFRENIYNLMRQCGYHPEGRDEKTGELFIFVRRLSPSDYPRFHAYLKTDEVSRETQGQAVIINLHLDQKKPVYKGAPAHAAEYQGKVVEEEAERIKKILEQ